MLMSAIARESYVGKKRFGPFPIGGVPSIGGMYLPQQLSHASSGHRSNLGMSLAKVFALRKFGSFNSHELDRTFEQLS